MPPPSGIYRQIFLPSRLRVKVRPRDKVPPYLTVIQEPLETEEYRSTLSGKLMIDKRLVVPLRRLFLLVSLILNVIISQLIWGSLLRNHCPIYIICNSYLLPLRYPACCHQFDGTTSTLCIVVAQPHARHLLLIMSLLTHIHLLF